MIFKRSDYLIILFALLCISCQEQFVVPNPHIAIYPNPILDRVNIEITNYKSEEVVIILLDGKGKSIESLTANSNSISHSFDLSDLPAQMINCQIVIGKSAYEYSLPKIDK